MYSTFTSPVIGRHGTVYITPGGVLQAYQTRVTHNTIVTPSGPPTITPHTGVDGCEDATLLGPERPALWQHRWTRFCRLVASVIDPSPGAAVSLSQRVWDMLALKRALGWIWGRVGFWFEFV